MASVERAGFVDERELLITSLGRWLHPDARQGKPDAGRNHRRPAAVHGLDDLVRVDAL
jgi:hypothetical protein